MCDINYKLSGIIIEYTMIFWSSLLNLWTIILSIKVPIQSIAAIVTCKINWSNALYILGLGMDLILFRAFVVNQVFMTVLFFVQLPECVKINWRNCYCTSPETILIFENGEWTDIRCGARWREKLGSLGRWIVWVGATTRISWVGRLIGLVVNILLFLLAV